MSSFRPTIALALTLVALSAAEDGSIPLGDFIPVEVTVGSDADFPEAGVSVVLKVFDGQDGAGFVPELVCEGVLSVYENTRSAMGRTGTMLPMVCARACDRNVPEPKCSDQDLYREASRACDCEDSPSDEYILSEGGLTVAGCRPTSVVRKTPRELVFRTCLPASAEGKTVAWTVVGPGSSRAAGTTIVEAPPDQTPRGAAIWAPAAAAAGGLAVGIGAVSAIWFLLRRKQ